MKRWMQLLYIVLGSIAVTIAVLAGALAWGPHQCKLAFPMVIGCTMGSYEALTGGLIASASALIAGWLAWSGVQIQIAAEERRAIADRKEVEEVLAGDILIDMLAEALAAIWKIVDGIDESQQPVLEGDKLEAVKYGIGEITKENWLSTSRRMVTVLGWERRRRFEQLFDGLDQLRRFSDAASLEVHDVLDAVKDVSIDFELVEPKCAEYIAGLFRRAGKAWSLGYSILMMAGIEE
jgi:hypothetical protein